jgi:hypothetical protein
MDNFLQGIPLRCTLEGISMDEKTEGLLFVTKKL